MTAIAKFFSLSATNQAGQTTIEWALLLAAFVLPMAYVIRMLLDLLAVHYGMVVFLHTLPFP